MKTAETRREAEAGLSCGPRKPEVRRTARRVSGTLRRSADLFRARLRHASGRGPAPLRMLLLSDGLSAQSEAQFDPILRHRHRLLRRFGLVLEHRNLDTARLPPAATLCGFDLIGFKLFYKTRPADVSRIAAHFRSNKRRDAALVYCDGNDEMTIQWPELLRHCDVYWKKNVFRDRSLYLRSYRGGTNLTDYALREEAARRSDQIPAEEPLLAKLVPGYSIALDAKIAALAPLLRDEAGLPAADREHDVVLRADVPDNWMGRLRKPAVETLRSLQGRVKVLFPRGRVPQDQYADEMKNSRICLSPFGYGEICWRDFEAAAYGCLLVKPDMGHAQSRPDIFQPFRTYVPVAWDFADLAEKLLHYARNPGETAQIVAEARRVLADSLEPEWFLGVFGELMQAAGYPAEEPTSAARPKR